MNETTIGKYKLSNEEVQNIQGKDYIKYSGLLRLAHENNLMNLTVLKIVNIQDGVMCHVRAEFGGERITSYDGIGTGTTKNLKSFTQIYPYEMAQTRAKARALRDALGIGEAAAEEMN